MLSPNWLPSRSINRLSISTALTIALLLATIWHLRASRQIDDSGAVPFVRGSIEGKTVVEIEGLTLGRPFSADDTLANVTISLRKRFADTLSFEVRYPSCHVNPARYAKTALSRAGTRPSWRSGKRQTVVSIAINLYDSEAIIPAQSVALVEAIGYLLKYNTVYVSVFENGSDDKTRALLSDFAAALQAIGVDGLWVHCSHLTSPTWAEDRIVMLSEIRNMALMPLMPYATNAAGEGTLLFINDVVTCASDVLEL
ncbi:hypothetical protein LTR53_017854, partial [Teratosphaeriaceae sp. CCFEE 6253]